MAVLTFNQQQDEMLIVNSDQTMAFAACGFGRRASDGGANLQQKEKQQQSCEGGWSHPSSREQLSTVSAA